jgi:hypothetical protein
MVRHQDNESRVIQGHDIPCNGGYAVAAAMAQRRWWEVARSPKHWLCLSYAGEVSSKLVKCQSIMREGETGCASYEGLCKQQTKLVPKFMRL